MNRVRIFHDGGACKEADFKGFSGQQKALLRYAGVFEFSLVHGYGLGKLDCWHIHSDDLVQLRAMARAKGMKFSEGPRPQRRPLHTRPIPTNGKQGGLFE